MASYHEPMDVDEPLGSDDKENSFRHNGPGSAEMGYEELDVSEVDMRLRLSCTPLASPTPTPRRFTGSCKKLFPESGDYNSFNETFTNDSANVTMTDLSDGDHNGNISERDSRNSTITLLSEDNNKNTTVMLQSSGTSISSDGIANNNAPITLDTSLNVGNKMSTPTGPIAITAVNTTANKEPPKTSTSPIMRGLKSVLSMFRTSQSPISALDGSLIAPENAQDVSPVPSIDIECSSNSMSISTPVLTDSEPKKSIDQSSLKGNSPHNPDSIVFNEDLINDLQWNDDTTIIFNKNKLPVRKLYTPVSSSFESHSRDSIPSIDLIREDIDIKEDLRTTPMNKMQDTAVEYMDITMDDSITYAGQDIHSNLYNKAQTDAEAIDKELIQSIVENVLQSVYEKAEETVNELLLANELLSNTENNSIETIDPSMNTTITLDNTFNKQTEPCLEKETNRSEENSSHQTIVQTEKLNPNEHLHIDSVTSESKIELSQKEDSILSLADPSEPHSEIKFDEVSVEKDKTIIEEKLELSQSAVCEIDSVIEETVSGEQYMNAIHLKENEGKLEEIKTPAEILNNSEQKGTVNGEEIISSVNNSPYVSLNARSEQENFDKLPAIIVPHLDNAIECSVAANSEIYMSHPKIDFDEIANPFATRSRVTMSPPRDTNQTKKIVIDENEAVSVSIDEPSEIKIMANEINEKNSLIESALEQNCLNLSKASESVREDESQKIKTDITNYISMEHGESNTLNHKSDISNVKEWEDLSIALESISSSTPSGSDIIHSSESQDHSDAYLSANSSGRESEQLLDSELEMIDKNRIDKNNVNLHKTNGGLEYEFETKKEISIKPGIDDEVPKVPVPNFDCENPFATKTNIRTSPPILEHTSPNKILGEPITNNGSPFATNCPTPHPQKASLAHSEEYSPQKSGIASLADYEILSEAKCVPQILKTEENAVNVIPVPKNENYSVTIPKIMESPLKSPKILDQLIAHVENPFETTSSTLQKPVQNIEFSMADTDNPFATKTKIRMSPPLIQEGPLLSTNEDQQKTFLENYTSPKIEEQTVRTHENTPESKTIKTPSLPKPKKRTPFGKKKPSSPRETTLDVEATSFADVKNPFATKTKIRMSPPFMEKDENLLSSNEPQIKISSIEANTNISDIVQPKIETNINGPTTTENENAVKIDQEIQKHENVSESKTYIAKTPVLAKGKNISKAMESPALKETPSDVEVASYMEIENPFATKSKIRISPPTTSFSKTPDDPFVTKSKMRISPPLLHEKETVFIPISEPVISSENNEKPMDITMDKQNNAETTFTIDNKTSNNIEKTKPMINVEMNEGKLEQSPTSENDGTISSAGSNLSQNITVKEVKTEDEDTIEGPDFVDLDEAENPFETKSKIRISTPVFNNNSDVQSKSPKVILCSDMASTRSNMEDLVADEELIDCPDEEFKPGELFMNADTFDFLMNQNPTTGETDHGKESLFLKFDPLCAIRRNSNETSDAQTSIDSTRDNCCIPNQPEAILEETIVANHSVLTPTKSNFSSVHMRSYTPESTNAREQHSFTASNSTPPEKPVLAVMPAMNDQHVNTRSTPYTPTRPERRSMTFASPAIAAIDRLISLSGNNSPANQNYYLDNNVQSQESNEAILEMRQLLTEKESEVDQLRMESTALQDRLTDLEIQMRCLQEENDERLRKITELKSKLAHKTALNKNMAAVVEEYERAISGMIGENEQEKQRHESEKANLVRERDEQIAHLNSMEVSFSDLHTKYERTKQVILTFKANEELLRKTIEEYRESQHKLENNYEILKQQAIGKLNNANMELDKIKRSHDAEVVKLNAQIKRKELHVTSLEESLAQKIKANEELTSICDELISKVG